MRKWQNLAPADDPNSYFDVNGVWPTERGSYETVDFLSGTEYAASGASTPVYAFTAQVVNQGGIVEFVVDGKIWSWGGSSFTDVTNGVTVRRPHAAQFGNVTIMAMGGYKSVQLVDGATVASTSGGNFSALAGAPAADIVAVQSNIAWYYNLGVSPTNNGNGWETSDVGDHTTYGSGEAASGNLTATAGDITAAVPFADYMVVFKANSIYRQRYVGGIVKIATELLHNGVGCIGRHAACAGKTGILFVAASETSTYRTVNPTLHVYWFDGYTEPVKVNTLTALTTAATGLSVLINYDPRHDLFSVVCRDGSAPYNRTFFYCPSSDMWGKNDTPITNSQTSSAVPLMGDFFARRDAEKSPMPTLYNKETADTLKRYTPGTPIGEIASSCYLETSKVGLNNRKSKIIRLMPLLRRRVDLGTDSTTLTVSFFRELHDTTASSTQSSIAESSYRKWFDFTGSDNYARFKVTYNALDVEVDNLVPEGVDAGKS